MLVNRTDSRRDFKFTVPPSVESFPVCMCCTEEGKKARERKREKEEWSVSRAAGKDEGGGGEGG